MNTPDTKRLTVAAAFCLALASFSAMPSIATEPAIAPAEAAATYKVTLSGMT